MNDQQVEIWFRMRPSRAIPPGPKPPPPPPSSDYYRVGQAVWARYPNDEYWYGVGSESVAGSDDYVIGRPWYEATVVEEVVGTTDNDACEGATAAPRYRVLYRRLNNVTIVLEADSLWPLLSNDNDNDDGHNTDDDTIIEFCSRMGSVHSGDCFQAMMMALAQARSMAAMDPFAGTAPVAYGAAGYGKSGILDASDASSGNEGAETQCGDASQTSKNKKKKSMCSPTRRRQASP